MDEINFSVDDRIHIVFNILRIGGDDRAVVVVVGVLKLVALVRNGRVEDVFYAFVDQPLHVSVRQLGRVTLGFTWDRLNAQLVDLSRGSRGEYHAESQFCEKCKPERIVLVHIQNTGDTDHAAFCFLFGKRLIIKITMELVVKQVRHSIL